MGEQWKPSALRAAGDIDRQAADDIEFGVTISTRDGRQLVHEWRDAIARAERAELRLTQYRKLAIDDHVLAIGQHLKVVHERDAALARAERAEASEARLSAIPFDEIGSLASAVDDLSFGQSRSARIVLDWLSSAAPAKV